MTTPAACPKHDKPQLQTYIRNADEWVVDYECGCIITSRGPGDVARSELLRSGEPEFDASPETITRLRRFSEVSALVLDLRPCEIGPFARMTIDGLNRTIDGLEAERDRYRNALREIVSRPPVERNPDGDDQAAHTMQLIAHEALTESKD